MIKAKATLSDGRPLYLFGLSARNFELMREGKPITVSLDLMGGYGEIILMFGESEAKLVRELGHLIGPNTELRGFPGNSQEE